MVHSLWSPCSVWCNFWACAPLQYVYSGRVNSIVFIADVDHSSNCTATPRSLDGRASMESIVSHNSTPSALARRSIDAASLRAEMRGLLFGSKGGPGEASAGPLLL